MKRNGSDEQLASQAAAEWFSFSCFHDLRAGAFLDIPLPGTRRSLSPLSCSLLAPRNPPLAHLLPDCPKVRQKPPVTLNFFTVLSSNGHFITLRRCGRRQSITNPPPLDPDLLWGAAAGPGTGCVGTQPSKDAPTCEEPCDKIIVQTT